MHKLEGSFLLAKWKKKWNRKLSIRQNLEKTSLWSLLTDCLSWLENSWVLIFVLLSFYSKQVNICCHCWTKRDLMMYYLERKVILRWQQPLNLSKYRWIRISPANTSTPHVGKVWNTLVIYRATFLYIFLNSLRW